jgi:hypothetical protein
MSALGLAAYALPPPPAAVFIWVFFFLFASIVPFLGRGRADVWGRSKWGPLGLAGEWIDRRWGAGTCTAAGQRFKPAALLALTSLTFGITSLASNYANGQSWPTYFTSGFFLAVGLGLAVAYLLTLRFPARLY